MKFTISNPWTPFILSTEIQADAAARSRAIDQGNTMKSIFKSIAAAIGLMAREAFRPRRRSRCASAYRPVPMGKSWSSPASRGEGRPRRQDHRVHRLEHAERGAGQRRDRRQQLPAHSLSEQPDQAARLRPGAGGTQHRGADGALLQQGQGHRRPEAGRHRRDPQRPDQRRPRPVPDREGRAGEAADAPAWTPPLPTSPKTRARSSS